MIKFVFLMQSTYSFFMNSEERQKFLNENVFNSKFSFAVVIGGWCGAYFFGWLAGFTNSSFLMGTGALFYLFGIFCIPAFLWYFLPITILMLPYRLQLGGQVVGGCVTALIPLLFLNGKTSKDPLWSTGIQDNVFTIIFIIFVIYIGQGIGLLISKFPTQNRSYLIASGIAWIYSLQSSHQLSTYLTLIVLFYIGVTMGIIKSHPG